MPVAHTQAKCCFEIFFSCTPSVLSWLWPASIKIIYGRALPLVGEYPAPHAAVPRVARGSSAVGWSVQRRCRIRQHPETGEEAVSHGTQASVRKKSYLDLYSHTSGIRGGGPGFSSHLQPSGADAAPVQEGDSEGRVEKREALGSIRQPG